MPAQQGRNVAQHPADGVNRLRRVEQIKHRAEPLLHPRSAKHEKPVVERHTGLAERAFQPGDLEHAAPFGDDDRRSAPFGQQPPADFIPFLLDIHRNARKSLTPVVDRDDRNLQSPGESVGGGGRREIRPEPDHARHG